MFGIFLIGYPFLVHIKETKNTKKISCHIHFNVSQNLNRKLVDNEITALPSDVFKDLKSLQYL